METRPPTPVQLLVAVAFALSCFGLLLFLWLSFGGPTPLRPEGYRVQVPFEEATQLAVESDVRISGVSVGKVKEIELGDRGLAMATVELDERYAPIPDDTRATLRQKTLLGETYVELTPGTRDGPTLAEGGTLRAAQVSDAVQLDEIFRTFDEPTRAAFQGWMQNVSVALHGRGADLSAALGNLDPFAAEANETLRILDTQRLAVRRLIRDSGVVFDALSERRGQLRGLVSNADTVFATTAARSRELEETFTAMPTFLEESRLTLRRLDEFAGDTDPLVQQLRPAARELSPTLVATGRLAPKLRGFFNGLRGTIDASEDGLPALRALLDDDLPPLFAQLDPFLRNLTPILEGARDYRREIAALIANASAATNAFGPGPGAQGLFHYLRSTSPLNPESLASYSSRLDSGRTNPYVAPGGYSNLSSTLEALTCPGGATASLNPADALNPILVGRGGADFFDRLKKFAFADVLSTAAVPAPPCNEQAPFAPLGDPSQPASRYQHVFERP